jgi:hypothetical protein
MAGTVGLAATAIAGPAADPVRELWERLGRPATERGEFDPTMADGLPEPARRWLTHVIRPGTALAGAVVVDMHGQIRIRRWLPFRAVQLQAPPDGYVWAARAALGPLHISGFDRYAEGSGQMNWRLAGRVPVLSAAGPNNDRSAAGRVALDAVFVPTAFLSEQVTWRPGPDPDSAVAQWTVGEQVLPVELRVGPDGALRSVSMPRWGNPSGRPRAHYPCGGMLDDERDFGGITLPTRLRAGYFFGTDEWAEGEFFRATITDATFR